MAPSAPSTPTPSGSISYADTVIGSGNRATTVTLVKPPPRGSPNAAQMTAIALQANLTNLDRLSDTHPVADLLSSLRPYFTSSTTTIEQDAYNTASRVALANLNPDIAHLEARCFFDNLGNPVQLPHLVQDRFDASTNPIQFVQVQAIVNLNAVDAHLPINTIISNYYIDLPQNPPSAEVRQLFREGGNEDDDDNPPAIPEIPNSIRRAIAIGPIDNTRPAYTYTGGFSLFESLTDFTEVFGPLESIRVYSSSTFPTREAISPNECFSACFTAAAWSLSKSLLWLDSIDSTAEGAKIPTHLIQALLTETATCVYTANGKTCFRDPAESFQSFLSMIPLLANIDPVTWGFNLPELYRQGFTDQVKQHVNDEYSPYYCPVVTQEQCRTVDGQCEVLRLYK